MYVINLNEKKSKEHTGFHYLLTETQLCSLIALGLNIFHKIKKYILLTKYLKYYLMTLLCVHFIAALSYMIAGKISLDNANLFFPNNYKNNAKIIYKYFTDKFGKKKTQALNLDLKK